MVENAILIPTDNTIFSVMPSLFNFSTWRIRSPGTMVKKMNPRNCLKIGMSRRIEMSVAMRNTSIRRKNLLADQLLNNSVIAQNAASYEENDKEFLAISLRQTSKYYSLYDNRLPYNLCFHRGSHSLPPS